LETCSKQNKKHQQVTVLMGGMHTFLPLDPGTGHPKKDKIKPVKEEYRATQRLP